MTSSYMLFIDDVRYPPGRDWMLARSIQDAKDIVNSLGRPIMMSLDHDLGGDTTVMEFLRWLVDEHYDAGPPNYMVHSENPVGAQNIVAYLESWRRSLTW
jgi:hypothetical protein